LLSEVLTMSHISCCPKARALFAVVALALLSAAAVLAAEGKKDAAADKPKYDSKEVMKQAHKGDVSLYKKVEKGTSTAADHTKLVELYKALAANKPPKGDQKSWDAKTGALVKAAEGLQKGAPNAKAQLKTAANCKACHTAHKPD
jgi:hypothetical protein